MVLCSRIIIAPVDDLLNIFWCEIVHRSNQVTKILLSDRQGGWSQPPEQGTFYFRAVCQVDLEIIQ